MFPFPAYLVNVTITWTISAVSTVTIVTAAGVGAISVCTKRVLVTEIRISLTLIHICGWERHFTFDIKEPGICQVKRLRTSHCQLDVIIKRSETSIWYLKLSSARDTRAILIFAHICHLKWLKRREGEDRKTQKTNEKKTKRGEKRKRKKRKEKKG